MGMRLESSNTARLVLGTSGTSHNKSDPARALPATSECSTQSEPGSTALVLDGTAIHRHTVMSYFIVAAEYKVTHARFVNATLCEVYARTHHFNNYKIIRSPLPKRPAILQLL